MLFFDSESYVDKPDVAPDDYWTLPDLTEPHRPRLVCAEYWERDDAARRYRMVERDREGAAVFPNAGAFREADYRGPAELCAAFWGAVDRCGTWTTHARSDTRLTLFAHNVGYDMLATGAYRHLPELGWELEHPYEKGPVFIQRASKGRHVMEVLSSTNYYAAKLSAVARAFGTEKLDFKDFNTGDAALLETYCRRDVEICRKSIVWLAETLDAEDLGPFKATISSTAFASWRYRFMRHPIHVHVDPDATLVERAGFGGGRTEAWFVGTLDGEVRDFDVNNLYGSIMLQHMLPVEFDGFVPESELSVSNLTSSTAAATTVLSELLDSGAGIIAEVDVDMKAPAVPLKAGKLLFPVGEFRTTLCGPELKLALQHGTVNRIVKAARYRMAPVFREFVEYYNSRRAEAQQRGDLAQRTLFKSMVNHVFGKLGQQAEEWARVGDAPVDALPKREVFDLPDGSEVVRLTMPGSVYQSTGERTEAFNAFPACAAYITSAARARLWALLRIANRDAGPWTRDPGHVYYMDTDSIFTDAVGTRRLLDAGATHESRLGAVKQEWQAVRVVVEGAKWYEAFLSHAPHQPLADKGESCARGYSIESGLAAERPTTVDHLHRLTRRKGIPGSAQLVRTPDGLKWAYEQFPRLAGHVGDGDVSRFRNRRVLKKATVEYTKGVHAGSGWVRPFRLPDDAAVGIVPGVEAV